MVDEIGHGEAPVRSLIGQKPRETDRSLLKGRSGMVEVVGHQLHVVLDRADLELVVGLGHRRRVFNHGLDPGGEPAFHRLIDQHPEHQSDDDGRRHRRGREKGHETQVQSRAGVPTLHQKETPDPRADGHRKGDDQQEVDRQDDEDGGAGGAHRAADRRRGCEPHRKRRERGGEGVAGAKGVAGGHPLTPPLRRADDGAL